jgi:hypothetical protein
MSAHGSGPLWAGLHARMEWFPFRSAVFQIMFTSSSAFHWQSGYGAFSVSQSDADAVIAFIRNQPEHHTRVWFQEEYRRFLDRYQIPYDERYVWD